MEPLPWQEGVLRSMPAAVKKKPDTPVGRKMGQVYA
jgi:hypothetical protein